jgi:6-phospho-beta-glucosidase
VSQNGIEPQMVGNLPRFLKGVFLALKESDRLTVEAVRHKSWEYALQALAINPFVPSLETARKYLERIVKDERIELH